MKNATSKTNRNARFATRTQKTLLPLVAVGGSLAGLPANALELGELTVQSRLGQPLRASIAFALAPNEEIAESCVSLGVGASASGLPGIGRATISVADGVILLTGSTPLREPMVAASVVIDCAYTANMSREYMLFIDPPSPITVKQPVVESADVAPAAIRRVPATPSTRRTQAARPVSRTPIGKSTRYRVQPGDSAGHIAERIENRSIGLWSAVDVIVNMNPEAFIDGDPNKLKAGSWLTIPSFDGSEPIVSSTAASIDTSAGYAAAAESDAPSYTAPEIEPGSATKAAPLETPVTTIANFTPPVADNSTDLSPAGGVEDADNPFVDTGVVADENIVIPDTELQAPTTAASPNVPTAVINTSDQGTSSSWMTWLAGSGIVLIIGLILFGRRFRDRSYTSPITPLEDQLARRSTDRDTQDSDAIAMADYDLEDDSPTEENLSLDADLVVGTGLGDNIDLDETEDVGFASPTEVDIELPFEPEVDMTRARNTEDTILDSEILPDDEEYDLSVIIDATKMPQPEDITQRDLKAIEVSADDETSTSGSYTINKEVDLDILAQDYEDEFTATQALNVEIARAAAELADNIDEDGNEDTSELELASVTELDVTAQMPSQADVEVVDELSDADFLVETATVMMTGDDETLEMPSADNDDDTDLDVAGGKVDTKAL